MQFKVPQFLEIEDKIFGPFTFREFVYLAGGGGICFILYKLLGLWLGAIPILVIAGFVLALTFYKPNNKPFVNMLEAGFKYIIGDKLFIWKRQKVKKSGNDMTTLMMGENKTNTMGQISERLNGNKLRDLAWSLDVLDLKKQEAERGY